MVKDKQTETIIKTIETALMIEIIRQEMILVILITGHIVITLTVAGQKVHTGHEIGDSGHADFGMQWVGHREGKQIILF